jgi:glutathione S-transferase
MAELILHHYDTSPFSEKIKKVLAHKNLAWRAVEQPTIMPKPHLIPLTGGYRRIPVLQIGADVYCDTQLIARTLDRRHPQPSIYPAGGEGTCQVWSLWADRMYFWTTTSILFALIGEHVPKEFIDDRTKMMPGRDFTEIPKMAPHAKEQCRADTQLLAAQLTDGRPYLLGSQFSLADAACYHPVWFLRNFPPAAAAFDEFPQVVEWAERIRAMGHGKRTDMSADEALTIAKRSTPAAAPLADLHEPNGIKPGDVVTVTPDDYGFDPVAGEVVASSTHEIAIRRRDDQVGDIAVHFPRIGFRVVRQ